MTPLARNGPTLRSTLARLGLLVGLLLALVLAAFGRPPSSVDSPRRIATVGGQGYWLLGKDGGVFNYGDAPYFGNNLNSGNDIVGIAPTPTLKGYWTADDDGTVFAYGDAHDYGSRVSAVNDISGFAARPQGDGYWLVTKAGVVTAKGAAAGHGNAPTLAAGREIVGMASTPSGNGYWLVGRDGGIFAFGDAGFYGSTGAIRLNQPIVGMTATASGRGYWFVAADGGVFSYGDAGFFGSTGASQPASGVAGIASTATGRGYWLVGRNGKIFPFGDAASKGDPSAVALAQPIVAIAATPITHLDQIPAAVADSASVAEDGTVTVDALANDAGLGDGPLSVAITSGPAHGSASLGADRRITYSPTGNFNGSDSITYRVTDADGQNSSAVLSLTVTPVNDAPVVQNRSLGTSEDTAAGGTFSGSDLDGDALTYSVVSAPAHGSVGVSNSSFTYTPDADYNGADSFTFRANDGSANSNSATVSVAVSAVADAPVVSDVSVSTDEDTPLSGSPSGFDADGDALSFSLVSQPTNGQLSGSAGNYTYTPDADFNGTDTFTYKASDGSLQSNVATVTVTVTPVNDAPAAEAGTATTDEDTVLNGTLAGTDIDEDALAFSVTTNPQHGTVTVDGDGYTYTPATNYHGPDSFAFVANDGTADSEPATVGITVDSVEDAPVFDESGVGTGTGGFVDIASTGTDVGLHDDDGSTTVPLPFPVSFYGTTYSDQVRISSNGWISFDGTDWSYGNGDLSGVSGPAAFLFWDDLRTDGAGHGIWTEVTGSAPNRKWIVQWNVTHYGTGGATVRFEAIFTENSPAVEFHYNDVLFGHAADNGAQATVGVVKDGTTRSQFSNNQPSLTNGLFLSYDTSANLQSVGSDSETVTDEDTPLELDVTATDGDDDPLTYAISGPAGRGTAVIDPATGHVTYTPDPDFNGDDTFTVSVTDGHSAPVTQDVTVTVSPVNDAPVIDQAGPLAVSVDEDDANGVTVATVTAQDVDSADTLTWSASDPAHGTVTGGDATGEFTYTPDADFDGTESFTITVSDGNGGTDTIQVDVTIVNPNNDPPVVSTIAAQSVNEDTTLEIPFTVGDPDTGDALTVSVGSSDPTLLPAGSLTVNGTGADRSITVRPAANLSGTAHLFLMVTDGELPQLQDIILTVNPVNDLPVANDDTLTTNEDLTGSDTLTGNDPVEGSAVSYSLVGDNGGAEHGTVVITNPATGAYTYQPDADWNGSDSFQFVANDGTDDSAPATVTVTVSPVADAPAFDGTGNSGSGDEETLISGTVSATDADPGDSLSYSIESGDGPADGTAAVDPGTGEWSYTGDQDFAGNDRFRVTVTDGDDLTDIIVVNVTVADVNDGPSFASSSVNASGNEDTAISGTVSGIDPDAGDTLTYSIEDGDGPADGTAGVDPATGAWSYTGDQDFFGTDSFTVTVTDADGQTATIVVDVNVAAVNDAPVFDAGGNTGTGNEEAAITGAVAATDVENDGLTYSIQPLEGADNGSAAVNGATGAWSYTGALDFYGSDSFTITVSDGNGGTATALVNVAVANVNDAPVVSTIGARTTDEDVPLAIPFTVSDADPSDTLSLFVGSTNPTLLPAGALSLSGSGVNRTLTITTPANLNGTADVFLSVSDGHAAPVIQHIPLTVNAVNDIPVANAGTLSTNEDLANGGTLTGNDPVEGSPLTFSLVGANGGALHGTVSITNTATGAYTYTPNADQNGPDSFSFVANDGLNNSLPATVSVSIAPIDDVPVANDDLAGPTDEDTALVGINVLANDTGLGDGGLGITFSNEVGGTASLVGNLVTFTPTANSNGPAGFDYTVTDGDTDADTAHVTIAVTPVNDAPAATDGTGVVAEDELLDASVPAATDIDSPTPAYVLVAGPSHGSLTLNADGTYSYDSDPNYYGPDSFTFKATDGNLDSNVATVTLTVTPVEDAPVLDVQSTTGPTVDETGNFVGNVVITDPDGDPLTWSIDTNDPGILFSEGSYIWVTGVNPPATFTISATDGKHPAVSLTINIPS